MKTRSASMTALAAATALLASIGMPAIANAQNNDRGSFLHRHRTLAAVGAGIAAHHYAKRGAAGRRAHGERPNFAERHPFLSGAAAAVGTHHFLKHHH